MCHDMTFIFNFQDDEDGHVTALHIIQELMSKGQELFLDHFARLGVFNMVHSMAGPPPDDEHRILEEGKMVKY